MMGLGLGLGLSNQPGAVAPSGPVELLVNGGFDSGANWTLTDTGAIAAGKFTTVFEGGGSATQTLVGGSVPAGDYVGVITIASNDDQLLVRLLGAGNEIRGTETFAATNGVGLPVTITANGEVSKYTIICNSGCNIDNVTLQAA